MPLYLYGSKGTWSLVIVSGMICEGGGIWKAVWWSDSFEGLMEAREYHSIFQAWGDWGKNLAPEPDKIKEPLSRWWLRGCKWGKGLWGIPVTLTTLWRHVFKGKLVILLGMNRSVVFCKHPGQPSGSLTVLMGTCRNHLVLFNWGGFLRWLPPQMCQLPWLCCCTWHPVPLGLLRLCFPASLWENSLPLASLPLGRTFP